MCHFLPVHHLRIAFLGRVEGQNITGVVQAKETVFGSLSNFCCPNKGGPGWNRISHPDWVKLCVELNWRAKPKYLLLHMHVPAWVLLYVEICFYVYVGTCVYTQMGIYVCTGCVFFCMWKFACIYMRIRVCMYVKNKHVCVYGYVVCLCLKCACMCVWVCVFVYVCVCRYVYVYASVEVCFYVYVCTCVYMRKCASRCLFVCVCACVCVCVCGRVLLCLRG